MNQSKPVFIYHASLDASVLHECYGSDYQHAESVFNMLLEELPANVADLTQLYHEGSLLEFRKYVHKIKPTFNYVGLTHISDNLQSLENLCGQITELKSASGPIDQIIGTINNAIPVLETEAARLKNYNSKCYEN